MKLDVSRVLRLAGQEFPFEVEQAIAPQDVGGDAVTFDEAKLIGRMRALEDDNIHVEGVLTTTAHSQCAKCLAPVDVQIEAEFGETFVRDGDPNDDENFAYTGSRIDFEKLAMSCAVVALPIRFVCDPECSGIEGYEVGDAADWQDDHHEATQEEHPFAALKQLLTKDEEV